jgi:MFS family permease
MAHSFMYGPQAAFIVEQFSPRLRSTGSSLAYTFAGVIGGAIAPLMFTLLLAQFGTWTPVAIYVAVAAVVTLIGLSLGRNSNTTEDDDYKLLLEGVTGERPGAGVTEDNIRANS